MDDIRIGRLLRALRRRRRLRQLDIATSAGVSQSLISLIERGHLDKLSVATLRSVFAAVDARFEGLLTWRGGAIDRLLDEQHAALSGTVATELASGHWTIELETTFNDFGDRGSIDILAMRPDTGIVLVVEIKTELTSVEETIRRLDVKQRIAPQLVLERYGWRPASSSRLLVLLDNATNRRRVAVHDRSLGPALPVRGIQGRRWLRQPVGRVSALLFSSVTNPRGPRPASVARTWGSRVNEVSPSIRVGQ